MKNYRYVRHASNAPAYAGTNHLGFPEDTPILLAGETALGQTVDGVFKVQVDRHEHPWAYGWHETPREDWEDINEEERRFCSPSLSSLSGPSVPP